MAVACWPGSKRERIPPPRPLCLEHRDNLVWIIEEGKSVSETITKDWHEPWRLDDIERKPLASKKVATDHAD
jgi:hypothetical protein